jgi:outer membrane receptor protein involved in Fe transport
MRKIFTQFAGAFIMLLLSVSTLMAQSVTISGTVTDKSSKEALPGVSVTVKGKTIGASTNGSGKFSFTTTEKTPFTVVVSYLGFKSVEATVSGASSSLNFELEAQAILGQEVVVAASRTPEKILESPVSIERVSAAAIRESGNNSFYDALANLKGVESSSQSLTFRSINTRGFNSNGNVRVNQITDGMDTQAPGLNFSVGNIIGLSELDVESVELLPGASSALYGSGGTNGTMLMNSKNPFTYPGLSAQLRLGANHFDDPSGTPSTGLRDFSFRYAVKTTNNRFAFKTSTSYLSGQDWGGSDYNNFDRNTQGAKAGTRATDPAYDGVNTYGDETLIPSLRSLAATPAGYVAAALAAGATPSTLPANLAPFLPVYLAYYGVYNGGVNQYPTNSLTRTGYNESDLVDYNTKSVKSLNSFHYKLNSTVEASLAASWGSGTTVYTGSERYSIKNFKLSQYKAEIKGNDFYLRAYTTRENSGDSYNATALGSYLNEYYSNSTTTWVPTYLSAFTSKILPVAVGGGGLTADGANTFARAAADANRFKPGTDAFNYAKSLITARTIGSAPGGAKFADKTFVNQYEGMYNFTNALNGAVELQVGGMYRQYTLNSNGTIFNDLAQKLTIKEYGGFIQLGKKFLDDKLKVTAATRYDKSQNFKGQFTPRVTGVYTVAPNNNIRVSYQTGFRIPTTQNQYISLNTGSTTLVGGVASTLDAFGLRSGVGQAYTRNSVVAGSPAQYNFSSALRPEKSQSIELGYKGLILPNLLVDVYGYSTNYKDFIASLALLRKENNGVPVTYFISPGVERPLGDDPTTVGVTENVKAVSYGTVVNNPDKVQAYGFGIGADYLYKDFKISANFSSDRLKESTSVLQSEFNTPEYRYNVGVSNANLYKNVGASVSYRYQGAYKWQSVFIAGDVAAFGTMDAQVNFRFPAQKLTMKFGGSNILNKYYRTNYGNPMVGAVYYVSFTFDQLMRK